MTRAVVIATRPHRTNWLADCLASLEGCPYQILILTEGNYELGKIKWVYEHTDIDEFLFLHDTCVVKDLKLLDMVFDHVGSVSITNVPAIFGCYLGKYRREILAKVRMPDIKDKHEAVLNEGHWTDTYARLDPLTINLFDDFDQPPHTHEFRHGRDNLRLENDYLIKFKGSWSADTIKEG